ncbi:MAG: cell wall hydrolase [Neomegalonema sp.]|nr:cell wall hydrolase [Neomegalonema sp.]
MRILILGGLGVVGLLVGVWGLLTVAVARPDRWSVVDGLAKVVEPTRAWRRTLRLGVDGDIAALSPSAHGLVVSGRATVAALASDYAMADAASLPRKAWKTVSPVLEDAGLKGRIAAMDRIDAEARGKAKVARLGPSFDKAFAAKLGVSFLEEKDRYNAKNGESELKCLAEAIYFEARGEETPGQVAVAEVVLTRVDSKYWPNTVCGVVRQGDERETGCQFSYACDGKPEEIKNKKAYRLARRIAKLMLQGAPRRLTGRATHYHAEYVEPTWARTMERTNQVGIHIFYRRLLRFSGKRG